MFLDGYCTSVKKYPQKFQIFFPRQKYTKIYQIILYAFFSYRIKKYICIAKVELKTFKNANMTYIGLRFSDHEVAVHAFFGQKDVALGPGDCAEIPRLIFDILKHFWVIMHIVCMVSVVSPADVVTRGVTPGSPITIATFIDILGEVLTQLD